MVVLLPLQIEALLPALLPGRGFTVITTVPVSAQPLEVLVCTKVYVVVTVGDTVGFASVDVKPLGLLVQL